MIRLLRPKHWIKNALLFIPLLMAHQLWNRAALQQLGLSFVAFSAVASAIYIGNDWMDREHDQYHSSKKNRPLASGDISPKRALLCAVSLLALGLGIGLFSSLELTVALLGYIGLNAAYSLKLKQIPIVDMFVLAGFYIIRLLAGGWIAHIPISNWLLAFSFLLFLSFGIFKRYTELHLLFSLGHDTSKGRGYNYNDQSILLTLGLISGFSSALVLALYVDQPTTIALYRYTSVLWGAVGVFMLWVMHIWFEAHRGTLKDDPVALLFSDKATVLTVITLILLFYLAL
jgi:4-hydroxybenzoate polyprenyltransferase